MREGDIKDLGLPLFAIYPKEIFLKYSITRYDKTDDKTDETTGNTKLLIKSILYILLPSGQYDYIIILL